MKMKAFIYSKVTNRKIATLTDVVDVQSPGNDKVVFVTAQDEKFTFNTQEIKATTYQN